MRFNTIKPGALIEGKSKGQTAGANKSQSPRYKANQQGG